MNFSYKSKGFSLVELMVIVAVLSLAASIFVPRFLKHQAKQRQKECHLNLQNFFEAEKNYFFQHQEYATDVLLLKWSPEGKPQHSYQFVEKSPTKFIFECIGNIDWDPTIDRATINEMGHLEQISDDMEK